MIASIILRYLEPGFLRGRVQALVDKSLSQNGNRSNSQINAAPDPMSEDRILNFVVRRLEDKTGFQTYSSGKKEDFYDICRVEVLAEIRVVD